MRHNQLPAWQALREQSWHYQGAFDLRRAFARQPGRFEAFRVEAPHVVDMKRQVRPLQEVA